MKLPLSWLRCWVELSWTDRELADRLTMLGFEVESLGSVAPAFSGLQVALIRKVAAHPQAGKLSVCTVDDGRGNELQIVCGASNARAGLRSALATVGARLPGGVLIAATQIRGVESQGMLCSARELGLGEAAEGILELPADAPLGTPLREYLHLDETLVEISITPNRGDAMSVQGLARELAAANGLSLTRVPVPLMPPVSVAHATRFPVQLAPGVGCPRFASRVIRDVDNRRPVPQWLRERLERSGLRSISPVVDATNFVLLELGQPLHAYDLGKLRTGLQVRRAASGEGLTLLDGRHVTLADDVLVIADAAGPVGMAGIMGGERSAVAESTNELLLEVAWFDPSAIAGRARRYGLLTDASQRYERGVDPAGQERALERATEVICAIAGGTAGPACLEEFPAELPVRSAVPLRAAQISRLLGTAISAPEVTRRLQALGMSVEAVSGDDWRVTPPSWRFDIAIEADLIEELARSVGLDQFPERPPTGARIIAGRSDLQSSERSVLQELTARGYSEAVTFGFTDPALQRLLCGPLEPLTLRNPIASNLAVMRASLWPGLLLAARENLRRQRERVRLFEIATQFRRAGDGSIHEQKMIAGISLGARLPEQWGAKRAPGDYYDLKGDVTSLLAVSGRGGADRFDPVGTAACLHPGRSAQIVRDGSVIGQLGELHPGLLRELDFTYAPLLFELDYRAVTRNAPVRFTPVSSYPQIRRDISFTVAANETFGRIAERVSVAASTRLHELRVFDIYQGEGVESGRKSVALGLILQDLSRTLTDAEADEVVAAVSAELRLSLDARIRE
ncbi:MAG TPA: phenylalanine--tRNA ligase subunit beta [Steroidobacteraceae bacterium]|nr:phenylalanine--tRNA ligase subunit beta [Steroidobacteraceae bacterium]